MKLLAIWWKSRDIPEEATRPKPNCFCKPVTLPSISPTDLNISLNKAIPKVRGSARLSEMPLPIFLANDLIVPCWSINSSPESAKAFCSSRTAANASWVNLPKPGTEPIRLANLPVTPKVCSIFSAVFSSSSLFSFIFSKVNS